jgi:hypothetical protein
VTVTLAWVVCRVNSVFYQNVDQADPVGQTGTDGENANDQQTLAVAFSGFTVNAGDMVVANCTVRSDQSGDVSFDWKNSYAALAQQVPQDSDYLAYSDAVKVAGGATETIAVTIENNGVGALAVCTLNHSDE